MLMLALKNKTKPNIKALKSVVEGNHAEVLPLMLKNTSDRGFSPALQLFRCLWACCMQRSKCSTVAFRRRGNNMALLCYYMLSEEVGTVALPASCVWVEVQCRINLGLIVLAGICQQSLPSCLCYAVAVNPSLL